MKLLALLVTIVLSSHFAQAYTVMQRIHPTHTAPTPPPPPPSDAHLLYFGGPVIANVKVYSINWGSKIDPTVKAGMGGFYRTITASSYMDWLSEYNTNITSVDGQKGTAQTIGRGTLAGEYTINPANTKLAITDAEITAELESQINAGHLPASDGNSYYAINFPAGISIDLGGATSCVEFCAYHGAYTNKKGGNTMYGVLPDLSQDGCNDGCGPKENTVFQNTTSTASHELVESITDPVINSNSSYGAPLAWYDEANGEIGDICVQHEGVIKDAKGTAYTVQGQWSNAQKNCVIGKGQPVPTEQ